MAAHLRSLLLVPLLLGLAAPLTAAPETASLPRECGNCIDLALDINGNPVSVYFSEVADELRLVSCTTPACASTVTSVLPLSPPGAEPAAFPRDCGGGCLAMAVSPLNEVIITFYDSLTGELSLITCDSPQCSTPDVTPVDRTGDAGIGNDVALRADGAVVVSYSNALGEVKLATCTRKGCEITTVDQRGASRLPRTCPGCTALALNSLGDAVIQYFDPADENPRIAFCNDAACASPDIVTIPVTAAGRAPRRAQPRECGGCSALALAFLDSPVVTYYDDVQQLLRLVVCRDSRCAQFGTRILDSDGDTGQDPSLSLRRQGRPVVSYYDVSNANLMLLSCLDRFCSAVQRTTVDAAGDVGRGSVLVLRPSLTGGELPNIAYYDFDNDALKLALCRNPACGQALIRNLDTAR